MLITEKTGHIVPQVELIFLFGSYARRDWVDGPHIQGRGRLTISTAHPAFGGFTKLVPGLNRDT